MSELLISPARPTAEPQPARPLDNLAPLLIVIVAIGGLYFGREIFVPLAIAILLSFVLSPPIRLVRHIGFGRNFSVFVIVLATLFLIFAISAILTRQVSDLSDDLPKYQTTISEKIEHLRSSAMQNPAFAKIASAIQSLGELNTSHSSAMPQTSASPAGSPKPVLVEIYRPALGAFTILQTIGASILAPLATLGLVAVYLVFILLQREDLRDRFIRLAGSTDLHRMTKVLNDAARRLSRYFLVQTLINAGFGVIVATGLALIGVPSPVLWGIVAFFMRFLPYLGSFLSAFFPVALAAAVDPGWTMVLETLALFLIVEPIVGQVVEPLLYGHNTGISPVAVVVSATFWAWLWGPVGLILATPLTLCLVVLGRNVERLAFLDILFGDAPALTPVEKFYQRMLANDTAEMTETAEHFLTQHSLVDFYDEVAIKALNMAQIDAQRGVLEDVRQAKIKQAVEEVIENLSDHASAWHHPFRLHGKSGKIRPNEATAGLRGSILCIAGRSTLDEAAAALLAQIYEKHGFEVRVEPAKALTLPEVSRLQHTDPQWICLSYLDAEKSFASARYAIRRLRRHLPQAKIVVCFWEDGQVQTQGRGSELEADFYATNLAQALACCLGETDPLALAPEADRAPLLPEANLISGPA